MGATVSSWDERFSQPGFAYGDEPNVFVAEVASRIAPGPVLCLAEGQGRNAVFLAQRGLDVTMMDQSAVGLSRARELAAARGASVATVQGDLADFAIVPGYWSGIVSVFAHVPRALRADVHRRVAAGLRPGGAFVFVAYYPRQLQMGTGGPKDVSLLPTLADLRHELAGLEFEVAEEVERELREGVLHVGRSALVQVLARRPAA